MPSIYRSKDDQAYKTEPNTPTHSPIPVQTLATSRSDPTPLNSTFSNPKTIFDDTSSPKKPVQKVIPSRTYSPNHGTYLTINGSTNNGSAKLTEYVKPKSPMKGSSAIMSHDSVPSANSAVITNGNMHFGHYQYLY